MNLYRFNNVPLALRADVASDVILDLVRSEIDARSYKSIAASENRPYEVVDGVAVVPIQGVLMNGWAPWWSGMTSYQDIDAMITAAAADPGVKAICMAIDSPGGEVAGCFDLADKIYALREEKPIVSILDESAYSAAYAIACAADVICVPRTGGTGSIGVIAMHLDVSEAMKEAGLKVSMIKYGDRKTELYPFEPLSKGARARLQSDVDEMGEMFVEMVARNRGISAGKVRATEAGVFLGANGVEAGLADEVMSAEEAFAHCAQL